MQTTCHVARVRCHATALVVDLLASRSAAQFTIVEWPLSSSVGPLRLLFLCNCKPLASHASSRLWGWAALGLGLPAVLSHSYYVALFS